MCATQLDRNDDRTDVGISVTRPDAVAKVTGTSRYAADVEVPNMAYAALVVSPVASGRIRKLDTAAARRLPGVIGVVTADDVAATNQVGIIFRDQPLLANAVVRMAGERLAVVVAETRAAALQGCQAVEVEVEETPGVYDVEKGLSPDAPKVHSDKQSNLIKTFVMKRGDVDAAASRAAVVIDNTYRIGGQEHVYLETQGCVAVPSVGPGGQATLLLYSSTQCAFYVKKLVCQVTGLPMNAVRVVQTVTGGGFGGKEDFPNEPAACAAVAALKTGRPVQLIMPREQDMQMSTKRHRMVVHHRLFADDAGQILGVKIRTLVDAGAYVGMSTVVAERSNTSCVGPYSVDNVDVQTHVVYTNNLFGGPFRGFGAPQVTAAHEAQMEALAAKLSMDPLDTRKRNLLTPEKPVFATGETIHSPQLAARTLEAAARRAGWDEKHARIVASLSEEQRYKKGIGIGFCIYGNNLHHGGQPLDRGGAYLVIHPDATANVAIGISEMGQGVLAASAAIASKALGIPASRITVEEVDTHLVGDSGPTVASRGALTAGRAIIDAANQLLERLRPLAAERLGASSPDDVVADRDRFTDTRRNVSVPYVEITQALYANRVNPTASGWYVSEPRDYDATTGTGRAYMFYSFAAHIAEVEVDTVTGRVYVTRVTAAQDVGKVLHPGALEGQVEGGITQAVGWATMEELILDRGVLTNASLSDYHIPTAMDVPEIDVVFIEEPEPLGPFGAKGIGEPSFIPCGAAIMSAVSCAVGVHFNELPLVPERVLRCPERQ